MKDGNIERIRAAAYTIPTDAPEADGTYEWSETTVVLVKACAAGQSGIGYTYAAPAAARLIVDGLGRHVLGCPAMSPRAAWDAMFRAVRNLGRGGLVAMAISAVDCALWDLKARLLDLSLLELLGAVRTAIPVYGSGGFTSYSDEQLSRQFSGWVNEGIRDVKMKVGAHPECDVHRVGVARQAIGDAGLFVDANGAYDRKQALCLAREFAEFGVCWFEEPVSSDDLEGLHLVRNAAPAQIEIAAGEYGYEQAYFRRMIEAQAVDVVQADATRCGGVTGFLKAAEEIDSFGLPLSAHTAPSLHGALCCAVPRARNVEYFHDHVRIESMLLDGALTAQKGMLRPDRTAPGFGLSLKEQDAKKFCVYEGEVHG
ncbi:MAG TPA: enolase C-terminal domain-like protein [Bryobacteraceae bacterium]|nr:enolase C-terminal domain-like protein [Bryobacteraceae bacterium]